MHARTLSSLLQKILAVAMAGPALACGGSVNNTDGGNPEDGGNPIDTGIPGCTATPIDAASICGSRSLELSGDCPVTDDVGGVPTSTCEALCGQQQAFCSFNPTSNVLMCGGMCVGRMPAGLAMDDTPTQAVGEYLARAAYLEAAAVEAFRILARELAAHGAPVSLRRSIERAAEDEVRHARLMGELASTYGTAPAVPEVTTSDVRPLVDVALENAVEGCVRETYGALVAMWQAEHARDARVRRAMRAIAQDEVRHAALGWRVLEWTHDMLTPAERARVENATHRAVKDLEATATLEPAAVVGEALGLPTAARARLLVDAMRQQLWS